MRELFGELRQWRSEGQHVAIARVVRTGGSAPREPGAAMLVSSDGRVAGSVSGGCVEGAVVGEAEDALASGRPRLVRFGYSDDEAFAVGLTCGGTIELFVAPAAPPELEELERLVGDGEPVAIATVVGLGAPDDDAPDSELSEAPFSYLPDLSDALLDAVGAPVLGASLLVHADGSTSGSLGQPGLDAAVTEDAMGALSAGRSELRRYGSRGERRGEDAQIFVESFSPPPRMVIFGAVDFTGALADAAKLLGYRVTVCDARATFATAARFPSAEEVVVDWPDRYLAEHGAALGARDACCVLTHDPKFDVPAIVAALGTDVGYIGAMGSRRTNAVRVERLRETGCTDEQLEKVMAPIGLDLGARTPAETAVAIVAEIVARRNGRGGGSLRDRSGPIHERLQTAGAPA